MKPTMPTRRLRFSHDRTTRVYYTRWTDDHGNRHKRTFGSDKRQAEIKYAEFSALWKVDDATRNPPNDHAGPLTVSQLWTEHFEPYARSYYKRADGSPTGETTNIEHAFRYAIALYGSTPAAKFDADNLINVRKAMVDAGLCRNVVNQRVRKIRQVFRWSHSEGRKLVPADILVSMESVKALSPGRSDASESEDVTPVSDAVVDATLKHCPPTLAAMIRVQRLTGMRPAEVCIMRPCDIDRSGKVWFYRPAHHKTGHLNKPRVVAIGPRAQALIEPHIEMDLSAPVFSPAKARREREVSTGRALNRNRPRKTDRRVGNQYTAPSYYRAIQYAAKRAGAPSWSPNQLRHAWATEARRRGASADTIEGQMGHSGAAGGQDRPLARITAGYAHLDQSASATYQLKYG